MNNLHLTLFTISIVFGISVNFISATEILNDVDLQYLGLQNHSNRKIVLVKRANLPCPSYVDVGQLRLRQNIKTSCKRTYAKSIISFYLQSNRFPNFNRTIRWNYIRKESLKFNQINIKSNQKNVILPKFGLSAHPPFIPNARNNKLKLISINGIKENAFVNFDIGTVYGTIEIWNGNLEMIEKNAFNQLNVYKLSFFHTTRNSQQLSAEHFGSCSIKSLHFYGLSSSNFFSSLKNVEIPYLKIEYMTVTEHGNALTRNFLPQSHFVTLDLVRISFRIIEDDALQYNAKRISRLVISRTLIERIGEKIFKNFFKLSYLDLSNNRLSSIHPNAFIDCQNLKTLNLNGNKLLFQISSNPSTMFTFLEKLKINMNVDRTTFTDEDSECFVDYIPSSIKVYPVNGEGCSCAMITSILKWKENSQRKRKRRDTINMEIIPNHLPNLEYASLDDIDKKSTHPLFYKYPIPLFFSDDSEENLPELMMDDNSVYSSHSSSNWQCKYYSSSVSYLKKTFQQDCAKYNYRCSKIRPTSPHQILNDRTEIIPKKTTTTSSTTKLLKISTTKNIFDNKRKKSKMTTTSTTTKRKIPTTTTTTTTTTIATTKRKLITIKNKFRQNILSSQTEPKSEFPKFIRVQNGTLAVLNKDKETVKVSLPNKETIINKIQRHVKPVEFNVFYFIIIFISTIIISILLFVAWQCIFNRFHKTYQINRRSKNYAVGSSHLSIQNQNIYRHYNRKSSTETCPIKFDPENDVNQLIQSLILKPTASNSTMDRILRVDVSSRPTLDSSNDVLFDNIKTSDTSDGMTTNSSIHSSENGPTSGMNQKSNSYYFNLPKNQTRKTNQQQKRRRHHHNIVYQRNHDYLLADRLGASSDSTVGGGLQPSNTEESSLNTK
ncbi:hypothetical protein SNEBB_005184 [Seison nebaliae]|nr:hypothetical protein SNEBB_005184 [Seison nebaliae]